LETDHFQLVNTCGAARAGELRTGHGRIATPVFLPVGSQASVKTLTPQEVRGLGFDMLLGNTYHLYLRPGIDTIKAMGGLHRFMAWDGAILTDSGGYQVFSLAPLRRVGEEGVTFRSHIDGGEHFFTPEDAVACQVALGSDVMMVLDECSAFGDSRERIAAAAARTHRWAERCLAAWRRQGGALYAIVQGGVFPDLRRQSAEALAALDFPGYAIGGLSLGETKDTMLEMVSLTISLLPEDRPRYLMGVGAPEDIVEGVGRGIDIFDCALPTRVARNGAIFTGRGRVNIRKAAYATAEGPLDPDCDCFTCRNFSAGYVNHLFRAGELLALRLATVHNLRFIANLVGAARRSVLEGSFPAFREDFLAGYRTTDEAARVDQKQRWLRERGGEPDAIL
jgi:queuine tRNA-ribosyltransferase